MNKNLKLICLSINIISCLLPISSCNAKSNKIRIYLGMWPEQQLQQDVNMYNTWKIAFEKDNPEYEIISQPYTYSPDTVAAGAMAETLPTVFQTWFTEPKSLISNKYIRSIDKQVKDLGWYEKMDESMRNGLIGDDGNLYGIPRDGYGMGMVLNLKTLSDFGLLEDLDGDGTIDIYDDSGNPLYPTTYSKLKDWSEIINRESAGEIKGTMFYSANKNGGWLFSNLAWSFGAELEKQVDGKRVGNLNSKEVVQALEYIKDLKVNDLLPAGASFTYTDWYSSIKSRIATAFCGNDVVKLAVTNGEVDLKDIAFVPMPKGPTGQQYALFGGTPFVFSRNASDEQVVGALKFFEYMGRSPLTTDIAKSGLEVGTQLAKAKGLPVIPDIRPWVNDDYVQYTTELDDKYVNVDMDNYKDFYSSIKSIRHDEVKFYAQEMYRLLDGAIQGVLTKGSAADCQALLDQANASFNTQYMNKL